jgi:CRISPR-associated protein Cmr6
MSEINAQRKTLAALHNAEHAGLLLDRFLMVHGDKEAAAKRELLERTAEIQISPAYKTAFERWKHTIQALENKLTFSATTASALAIGLGNASPLEVGLSIHHTYGTPYLPGSAIKGLLTRAADAHGLSQDIKDILFGTTGIAAHITYWDAMLEPSSTNPFQPDVITVHHPKYYGSSGADGYPTDFDDPTPVAFLNVCKGVEFRIALSSSSENSLEWLYVAAELLKYALEQIGLGGKTNAGYGYFKVKPPEKPKSTAELAQALLEKYQKRIEGINGRNMNTEASTLLKLLEPEPSVTRGKVLRALLERLDKFGAKKESFYKRAKAMLEET